MAGDGRLSVVVFDCGVLDVFVIVAVLLGLGLVVAGHGAVTGRGDRPGIGGW